MIRLDGDRFLGVLTPDSVHRALRRSIDEEEGKGLATSAAPVGTSAP
jgi:hypothetical protein